MKIAVIGSGKSTEPYLAEKAKDIGREIAKDNHTLVTGGCRGYPYEAVKGALEINGKVVAYSPAKDKAEHIQKYGFPVDEGIEIIYTGLGVPERNIPLIKNSDAVVMIDGQIGTLNEFTLAFHMKKSIAVLEDSGGISELIPRIARICNKNEEKYKIIYAKNPKEIIGRITNDLRA